MGLEGNGHVELIYGKMSDQRMRLGPTRPWPLKILRLNGKRNDAWKTRGFVEEV